jgi:pimeloyl-ACP methyl ester carboxylesterase
LKPLQSSTATGAIEQAKEGATDFPAWFTEARAKVGGRYGSVEHEGCQIAYQAWGTPGSPTLLMLHGAGASSEWWEATAILLADRFHIVAPSFAGVGRSQWREAYAIEQCVAEAMACAAAEGAYAPPGKRPVCIAHSFGSETGVRLAIDPGKVISHLILIDSLMGLYGAHNSSFRIRDRQFYPSIEDAVGRFSTVPRDDFGPPFLRAHIARQSLEEVRLDTGETAWAWRADPNVMARLTCEPIFERIGEAQCPIDFIFGGLSSMNSPELREKQAKAVKPDALFLGIEDAGHHMMLDRPRELAEAISRLIDQRQS